MFKRTNDNVHSCIHQNFGPKHNAASQATSTQAFCIITPSTGFYYLAPKQWNTHRDSKSEVNNAVDAELMVQG